MWSRRNITQVSSFQHNPCPCEGSAGDRVPLLLPENISEWFSFLFNQYQLDSLSSLGTVTLLSAESLTEKAGVTLGKLPPTIIFKISHAPIVQDSAGDEVTVTRAGNLSSWYSLIERW